MTQFRSGIDITKVLVDGLENAHAAHVSSRAAYHAERHARVERPPRCVGDLWEKMLLTFEAAPPGRTAVDRIVGGKEVHDDALTMGDMPGVLFRCAQGVRDMRFLWSALDRSQRNTMYMRRRYGLRFGNTAMVLAEQKLISRSSRVVARVTTCGRGLPMNAAR